MSFTLSKIAEQDTRKALKSLIAHESKKEKREEPKEAVYLIINTDKPLAKQNDHVARIV